jgi:predicted RNase H-like HicB family nuclease
MKFPIVYEKVNDNNFSNDYYYAHIPTLGLTTHGKSLEGAKDAANDLIQLWIEEKILNNEPIHISEDVLFATLEVS